MPANLPHLDAHDRAQFERREWFRTIHAAWKASVRAYTNKAGYWAALNQARGKAIKDSDTDAATEPTPMHVDSCQRSRMRRYREGIRATLRASDEARGIDPIERERMNWRNAKRWKAIAEFVSGERSRVNDVTRKTLIPDDRAAHDRAKRAEAQRQRRLNKRRIAESRKTALTDGELVQLAADLAALEHNRPALTQEGALQRD
jgi:hypothetical protein